MSHTCGLLYYSTETQGKPRCLLHKSKKKKRQLIWLLRGCKDKGNRQRTRMMSWSSSRVYLTLAWSRATCTLRCKPIHKWTSPEVQLRIEGYWRELWASGKVTDAAQLKKTTTAITKQPSTQSTNLIAPEQGHTPGTSSFSLRAQHHLCHPPWHPVAWFKVYHWHDDQHFRGPKLFFSALQRRWLVCACIKWRGCLADVLCAHNRD